MVTSVSPPRQFIPSARAQENIVQYLKKRYSTMADAWNLRDRLESIDRAYQRESDRTSENAKAKIANYKGDPTKFQNIIVPVVLPQVENAVTYQTSVFLQGYPIFGVVAGPGNEDAAMQFDTLIGEQQIKGRWVNELIKAIRDGCKYNLMAAETNWELEKQQVGIANDTKIYWQGNKIKRMDLYNTFWDIRVPPELVSLKGEFQGYHELYSKISLKIFLQNLPNVFNVTKALESGSAPGTSSDTISSGTYYIPRINPESFVDVSKLAGFDWPAFMGERKQSKHRDNIAYRDLYQVTVLYARILPSDFELTVPGQNIPQSWKFIVINNQVVVYAERLTNQHAYLPIQFAQPINDGLGYQTKSLAQNVKSIQEITSALANSDIHSRRRALVDRLLFDPSRVSRSDLNNDSPVARIAIKASAFGKGLADAVAPIPFQDTQFQFNQSLMQQYFQMANAITGLNPARQGQFVKGNKTRAEFQEIMSYANGRDQLMAMSLEVDFFTPMKEIIKSNILQYQGATSVLNREAQAIVQVDPEKLAKATLEFKISDGLLPSDKIIDGEALALAFQTIQSVPQLQSGYNVVPMFSYLMKSRGARLSNFEKSPQQLAYEQALGQWQQAVSMVAVQIQSMKDISSGQVQQLLQSLPPQPTPQQFGYNPEAQQVRTNTQVTGGRSILDNMKQDNQGADTASTGQVQ